MHGCKKLFASLVLCVSLAACGGNVSVSGYFDSGAAGTLTASGNVSIVRLTYWEDANGKVTVTDVTLLQNWSAQQFTFCGSHATEFPMNASVTANYTPGNTCSTLISVKVIR